MGLGLSRLGLCLGSNKAGEAPAYTVTLDPTDLTAARGTNEARQGDIIALVIDPAITTEVVTYQWQQNGVNVSGATTATEQVAIGTDHNDGEALRCVVTIDGVPFNSNSAPMRYAPATGGVDLDLAFVEDSAIAATDLAQNWTTTNLTMSWAVTPTLPTGLSVNSSTASLTGTPTDVTADATYTLTGTDQYGWDVTDTFTLEITATDTTAPTATSIVASTQEADGDVPVTVNDLDEDSTFYWVLVPTGEGTPSAAQVVAGQNSAGGSPSDSGNQAVTTTGGPYNLALSNNLNASYDLHGVFRDAAGNNSVVYSDTAITIDTTLPGITSYSPADNATDVATDATLSIVFNETMKTSGTAASVTLKNVGGATIETFDPDVDGTWSTTTNTNDTWTVTPTSAFVNEADLAVQYSGFEDDNGNLIPAVADDTTWNFTVVAASAGIALVNSANVLADTTFDSLDNTIDSATYTPASNDNVLVIIVGMGDGEGITPTVSWGASTLTAEASDFNTSLNYVDTAAVYVVTSPGTTAQDVTVAKASGGRNWITVDIMEFSGVDTASPVVQAAISAGVVSPATSDSVTLTGTVSGNFVAGGALIEGDGATITAANDATLAHASASTGVSSTSDGASAALYAESAGGSVTLGVSSTNGNDMIVCAVELAAA